MSSAWYAPAAKAIVTECAKAAIGHVSYAVVSWLFGFKGGLVSQPQKIAVVSSSIAASI